MSDRNQYFPQDSLNLSYDVPHPDSRKPPIGDRVPSGVIPMESIAQKEHIGIFLKVNCLGGS